MDKVNEAELQKTLDYARAYVKLVKDFAKSKGLSVEELLGNRNGRTLQRRTDHG